MGLPGQAQVSCATHRVALAEASIAAPSALPRTNAEAAYWMPANF